MLLACHRARGAARFWVSLRRPRGRRMRRRRDTGLGLPTTLDTTSAGGGAPGRLPPTRARGPIGWYAPGLGRQPGVGLHAALTRHSVAGRRAIRTRGPWPVTAVRGEVRAV